MPETHPGSEIRTGPVFFPDLDGWRFIAFFAVFLFHAFDSNVEGIIQDPVYRVLRRLTANGPLGVDFFFVLSGFLIIYLLITERKQTGKIDIKKFYLRRILRIFPLYYLCLFIGFVALPFARSFIGSQNYSIPDWRYYVLFLSNFEMLTSHSLQTEATLGVLWSVAIEEQFYLTVPFLLLVSPTRFYPLVFMLAIVTSLVFRSLHLDDGMWLARHTFSFIGNLAIGGLVAYFAIESPRFVRFFKNLHPLVIKGMYLLVLLVITFRDELFSFSVLNIFQAALISCLFAFVILEQVFSNNSFFKMRNNGTLTRLGQYTYGLYCLHVLALAIGHFILTRAGLGVNVWQFLIIEIPFNLLLALMIAYVSYRFFESPFLKLKSRLSFQPRIQNL